MEEIGIGEKEQFFLSNYFFFLFITIIHVGNKKFRTNGKVIGHKKETIILAFRD